MRSHDRRLILLIALAFGSAAVACGDADESAMQSGVRGDTTFRRIGTRGLWPSSPIAKPALRIASIAPGPELGDVRAITVLPTGGVVLFDARSSVGPAVIELDSVGRYVRMLGRSGLGPGEFAGPFTLLSSSRDGVVFLFDIASGRINRYRDGVSLPPIRLPDAMRSGLAGELFVALPDHSVLVNGSLEGQRALGSPVFVRIDSLGAIVDSVIVRDRWLPASSELGYDVGETIIPLRAGGWLHMRSDRFGVLIRQADGSIALLAELSGDAPLYGAEEREELQRIEEWLVAGRQSTGAAREVPRRKVLVRHAFEDPSGRIWLRRTSEAVPIPPQTKFWDRRGEVRVSWGEPARLIAIRGDGVLLGELHMPVRASFAIGLRNAWAAVPESLDVPVLYRYDLPSDSDP